MKHIRYRHNFLIPAVVIAAAGMASCTARILSSDQSVIDGIITSAVCVAGLVTTSAGRRRVYRRITFDNFTVSDHLSYWSIVALSCASLAAGIFLDSLLLRILAGVMYLLLSLLLRTLLVRVKLRNAYSRAEYI